MFLNWVLPMILSASFAKELSVKSINAQFHLTMTDKKIHLSGYLVDLSMKKNKCNTDIMRNFRMDVDKLIRNTFLSRKKQKKYLQIIIEKEPFYLSYSSIKSQSFFRPANENEKNENKRKIFMCKGFKLLTLKYLL